jgi:protein arginine kinase
MSKWYEDTVKHPEIIVSSRIRLARNVEGHLFPAALSSDEAKELIHNLRDGLEDLKFSYTDLQGISLSEKKAFREHRILNSAMVACERPMGLLLSETQSSSVLLGGDDHIRIQCVESGAALHKAWDAANNLDDKINEHFAYAFNSKYGYLTAFPTNVGTGMRVSVDLHLPIISKSRAFKRLIEEMARIGLMIKGVQGDVAENYGDIYRICNQKTLGQSEEDIISSVEKIAFQLANQEKKSRENAGKNSELVDDVYKSFGVLRYARRLSLKEALIYLSQVRLGQIEEIIQLEQPVNFYGMMLAIQPGSLEQYAGHALEEEEAAYMRAKLIRENISDIL